MLTRSTSDITAGILAATAELNGADAGADFEDKSSYSITVVATSVGEGDDGGADDRGKTYARVDVTIKVVDGEDPGEVTLSAREPQDGSSVLATLDDPDGGETAVEWQWYRGGTDGDEDNNGTVSDTEREALTTELNGLEDDPEPQAGTTTDVCTDADGDNVAMLMILV